MRYLKKCSAKRWISCFFLRMKAAHAGHVSGADPNMLRFFGVAPDFPDRIPDQPEQEPARW